MNLENFKKKYAEMKKAQIKMAQAKAELRRLNAQKDELNWNSRLQKIIFIGESFANFWGNDLLERDEKYISDLMEKLFHK